LITLALTGDVFIPCLGFSQALIFGATQNVGLCVAFGVILVLMKAVGVGDNMPLTIGQLNVD
jgi:hypothetical protein